MNDETRPIAGSDPEDTDGSGSRWEPAPPTAYDAPVAPTSALPGSTPTRQRLALAGGAVAVLLIGGAGGFAIGNAAANGDTPDQQQRTGFQHGPGGEGFDPDGDHGGPGRGQLPQDQQQDQSGTTSGEGASTT